jgi:NAD(P)-dependent dehydrogenase (short-subunit alcohol dehydrogenase family)
MTVLDQFRLDDDVAVVTGAAGGIGGAVAEAMAEAGADVAIADVDEDGLADLADRMEDETDATVEAIPTDVSEQAETERLVAETVDRLGDLDVVFPNAGISVRGGAFPEYDMDAWDQLMDVNLRGAFMTARAAAGHMTEHGGGRIVNTASILGFNGTQREGLAAYTAAKGGVVQLTRQLAGELAEDEIRVNAIAPGLIETGMTRDGVAAFAEDDGSISRNVVPWGRIGQPEDLKGLAVFLASDASAYVDGEIVLVDGGMNAV